MTRPPRCVKLCFSLPFVRGGKRFGGLYPDGRVPFSRGEHDHLIQELVDTGQEVLPVLRLIGNVMEDLRRDRERQGSEV